jgi:hypothetical protein
MLPGCGKRSRDRPALKIVLPNFIGSMRLDKALVGFQGGGVFCLRRRYDFSRSSGAGEAITLEFDKSVGQLPKRSSSPTEMLI